MHVRKKVCFNKNESLIDVKIIKEMGRADLGLLMIKLNYLQSVLPRSRENRNELDLSCPVLS